MIPATIREVVERAKLYALTNSDSDIEIRGSDIALSASMMTRHMGLLNKEKEAKRKVQVLAEYSIDPEELGGEFKEEKVGK